MFDQALNTSLDMRIIFVLFYIFTLFLVWCNQTIDAAWLPLLRRVTIDECHHERR